MLKNKILKKNLLILFILSTVLLGGLSSRAQNPYDLPMACVGSVESYWVRGFNGMSDFDWQITGPSGQIIDPSNYTIINRGDSIQVYWNNGLPGGIYTFRVIEHSDYGCTGEPYEQNIVLNSPTINIPFDGVPETVSICFGQEAALNPGNGFLSYLWQDGSTNQIFYTGTAGTYQVQLINSAQSCTYNEIETFINPLPMVWLGNDTVLFGTQSIDLPRYVSDNVLFYNWSTGDITPTLAVSGTEGNQTISLTVTDANGCTNSDEITVSAADYSNLRIPAAFTPNGDGVNDTWLFPAPDGIQQTLWVYLNDVDVKVFNRWGKLVWKSEGMFRPWDGKGLNGNPLPMDSYHYIISINVDGKSFTYKGSVTIVR